MIIKLQDGLRIQAEITDYQVSSPGKEVQTTIDAVRPLLVKAVEPVVSAWTELSKTANLEKAEIELSFGIESSGNFFIASAKGSASLKVTLTISRKPAGETAV